MGSEDAAAAREWLERAAAYCEGDRFDPYLAVRIAGVHALLVTAEPDRPRRVLRAEVETGDVRSVRQLVNDPGVVAYGEVVSVPELTNRLRALGHPNAQATTVSNELGRAVARGDYARVRRGWFARSRRP